MATFKIWGIGDLVRDEETLPFSGIVDYNEIEALTGHDINNHIDIRRQVRNLYENEENIFDFLENFAETSQEAQAIYKNSLEWALACNSTTDIVAAQVGGSSEQTQFTISWTTDVNDLQGTYFDLHSSSSDYYIWFNIDSSGIDPGVDYPESSVFTVSSFGSIVDFQNKYFRLYSTTTDYYVWFNVDGSGSDPDPDTGASTGIEVPLGASLTTPSEVVDEIVNVINGSYSGIFTASDGGASFTITNVVGGNVTDSTNGDCGALLSFDSNIDGIDRIVAIDGYIAIEVGLNSTTDDTEAEVASAIESFVDAEADFGASTIGAQITITNVVTGNVTDTGTLDTTGFTFSVTDGNAGYKFYVRVAPGIAYINEQIVVVRPQTYLAERQLVKILNLENWHPNPEEVIINYDYTNDKYQGRITKRDGDGVLQTYTFVNGGTWGNFTTGYDTGVELLRDIYNHSVFYTSMHGALNNDLTLITLEPVFEISAGAGVTKYISLMNDGEIYLRDTTGDFDLFDFDVDLGQATDDEVTVNTFNDTRIYYTNYNDFKTSMFLNVPNSLEDTSLISDSFNDATLDYSSIENNNTFITILNQGTGPVAGENRNVVFGYVKDDLDTVDTSNYGAGTINSTDSDVFYFNRDIIVRDGVNPGDWFSISNVASSVGSGLPIVTTYNNLPLSAGDGAINFVSDVNQFYRYNSNSATWVPVSDPYKQFWAQDLQLLGTDADDAPTNTQYTFSGIIWKADGSNINVYVNGVFQVQNSPGLSDHEYDITSENSLEFNTSLLDTDTVTVSVVAGGENYYPEKINYTVGTSSGDYSGSQFIFPTAFELLRTKTDVYINGVLQRESEFVTYATETAGSNTDRIVDDTQDFTGYENYFVIVKDAVNTANNYLVRKVDSVTTTTNPNDTLVLKSIDVGGTDALPANTSIGDDYEINENYDYVINEDTNEIYTSVEITADAFVEIRNRAGVASTYTLGHKGTTFPSDPTFGQEFYNTSDEKWYKFNGISWVQIS